MPPHWRLLAGLTAGLAAATMAGCATLSPPPALVLDDAERFAALLTASAPLGAAQLQAGYLDPGTAGVRTFTPHRIVGAANLAAAVARGRAGYEHAATLCLPAARQLGAEATRLLAQIGEQLGQSQPAPVYILFGAGNSGGTADAAGLVLGLEVICRGARDAAAATQLLRDFIAHEMTHVYQARQSRQNAPDSLLRQALVEGLADHLMENTLGDKAAAGAQRQRYGLAHEAELWREFKADVDAGRPISRWFYDQRPQPGGRPPDMGYWIGKRICEAYVQGAPDRPSALQTLLALRDPVAILAASGYDGMPKALHARP